MKITQAYSDRVEYANQFLLQLEEAYQSGSQAAKAVVRKERVPHELHGKFLVSGKNFREEVTNLCHALVMLDCEKQAINVREIVDGRERIVITGA